MPDSLTRFMSSLFLLASIPLQAQDSIAPSAEHLKHVNYYDLPWTEDPGIPLSRVARWKTLLGSGGVFGEGLPDNDMYIRQGEMGPGAIYPKHRHPAPEFWYFVSGRGYQYGITVTPDNRLKAAIPSWRRHHLPTRQCI